MERYKEKVIARVGNDMQDIQVFTRYNTRVYVNIQGYRKVYRDIQRFTRVAERTHGSIE